MLVKITKAVMAAGLGAGFIWVGTLWGALSPETKALALDIMSQCAVAIPATVWASMKFMAVLAAAAFLLAVGVVAIMYTVSGVHRPVAGATKDIVWAIKSRWVIDSAASQIRRAK